MHFSKNIELYNTILKLHICKLKKKIEKLKTETREIN